MGKSKRMVRETGKKHYSKSKPDIGQRKEVQDFSGRAVDEKVRFQHQIIHKGSKLESNHLKGDPSEKKNHIHKKSNDKSLQTHSNNQDANKSTIQLDSLRTKMVNQESSQQSHPAERLQVESRPPTQRRQVQFNQHNSFENQKFSQTQNDNATTVQTSLHFEIKSSFEEDIQPPPLEMDARPPELVNIHEDFVDSTELFIKMQGDIESKTSHIQGKSVSLSNQSNVRKNPESPFRRFETNQSRIVDADSKFSHRRNEGETKLIHHQSQENTSQLRKKKRRIHGQVELVNERGSIFLDRPLSPFETGSELTKNITDSTVFVETGSIVESERNEKVIDDSILSSRIIPSNKSSQKNDFEYSNSPNNRRKILNNSQRLQNDKPVTLIDEVLQSSDQFQLNLNDKTITVGQTEQSINIRSKKLLKSKIRLFSSNILQSNAVSEKVQNEVNRLSTRNRKLIPSRLVRKEANVIVDQGSILDSTNNKNSQIEFEVSKPTSNTSPLPVDRRPRYALTKTTMNQTFKGRLPSKNNIKVKPTKPLRFPNGQVQVHEKINSLVNEPIEFFKDRKYHRLSKNIEKTKLGRIQRTPLKKVMSGIASSEFLAASYLQAGAEENVAVDATTKALNIHATTTMKIAQKSNRKKTLKKLTKKAKIRQSQLEFRHKYRLLKEDKTFKRQSFYRKAMYRHRLRQQIRKKHLPRFGDRIKEEAIKILNQFVQYITTKWKSMLVLVLAVFSLLTVVYSNSQFMFGALSSVSYQLTTTSYLSSEEMLIALNHIFSTYELTLSNQLTRLKESKPGYEEYIVKGREQIGHDPHVLLAYLTARFGEIKDHASVEPAMRQLFEQMYQVTYREEKEIRYRTVKEEVLDTSGKKTIVEKRVPYLYRKLIATVSKKDMDGLVHEIFASKPQNLEHYKILRESKGNLEASFPSGTGISLPGNVSSVYDVNLTGGNFPPPNPSHVAALNGGYPGQCTWYVYNRFSQLGKPIQHSPMGNGGEWAFYAAKYGYPVSREARAGTAVCMPPTVPYADPTYGHIAFVERVNPDGSIVISEMNVKGEFVISTGYLLREMAAQCYYINFGL
ncbi:TPA: CHAP domain-containing protein [Streptococcus suis]